MEGIAVSRLRWMQRRCLDRLGWQGMTGIVLLAISAMAWLAAIAPLEGEIAALRMQAGVRHFDGKSQAVDARAADPVAQLQAFHAFFDRKQPLEAWLSRLYALGERNGLLLREARYEPADAQELGLRRYRISIPVTARYPQLRGFLSAALAQIPVLSLDRVALHRNQAGDATVDAQLQFTLYLAPRT
jgi:Tfp pilus assembly protein PilO